MKLISKILKSDNVTYILSESIIKGFTYIISLFFAALLTVEQFGIMNYYDSTLRIIIIIVSLSLSSTILRYKEISIGTLFKHFIVIYLFMEGLIILLFPLLSMTKLISEIDFPTYFIISLNGLFIAIQTSFLISIVRMKKSKYYLLITILTTLQLLVFTALFFYIGSLIKIVSSLLSLFWIVFLFIKNIDFKSKLQKDIFRVILMYSLPLVVHVFFSTIIIHSDKILINTYFGSSDLAQYSFAYLYSMALAVYILAMNKTWIPNVYSCIRDQDYNLLRKKAKKYYSYFSIISVIFLLIAPNFFEIFNKGLYLEALNVAIVIILSYNIHFFYNLYMPFNMYDKKNTYISLITIFGATVNVILNIVLFRYYGYFVASITTFISYLVLFLGNYMVSKRGHKKLPIKAISNKYTLLMFTVVIVVLLNLEIYFRVFLFITLVFMIFKDIKELLDDN